MSRSASKPPPPSARRHSYTPELLAAGRDRYERTEESITSIAVDFGVHKSTFQRMAARLGWVRYVAPSRDLPPAVRLLAQATALEDAMLAADRQSLQGNGESLPPAARTEEKIAHRGLPDNQSNAPLPPPGVTIEQLHLAVLEEVASVKALRAQLKRRPRSALDGERTARTLASLTETVGKLQRLQCGDPPSGQDHDDMPIDLDEFRNELARRIEAFVESRADEGGGGEDGAVAMDHVQQ
jgi:hypothetical protein